MQFPDEIEELDDWYYENIDKAEAIYDALRDLNEQMLGPPFSANWNDEYLWVAPERPTHCVKSSRGEWIITETIAFQASKIKGRWRKEKVSMHMWVVQIPDYPPAFNAQVLMTEENSFGARL